MTGRQKTPIQDRFQPPTFEGSRYAQWERSGGFAADPDGGKPPYTIMMPPPNVTGILHMGHALTFTLQDVLVRYQRMRGRDVLWQPGTDHAGIATEIVVSNKLAEENTSKHDIGREGFVARVWKWNEQSGGTIINQLRRLGASPDWYRERFTMPKFIMNSAGDQYLLPDSSRFYFDDLPGEKYLRYVPNTDHRDSARTDAM